MMISCIVVDHSEGISTSNKVILEELFHGDHFEIDEYKNGIRIIFIYGVQKIKVWQAVLYLEMDQLQVGFGFGLKKEVAREEAFNRLRIISAMNIH